MRPSMMSDRMPVDCVYCHKITPDRIDPCRLGEMAEKPVHPNRARLRIPVLHRAAGGDDFVGAHGRVADEDEPRIGRKTANDVDRRRHARCGGERWWSTAPRKRNCESSTASASGIRTVRPKTAPRRPSRGRPWSRRYRGAASTLIAFCRSRRVFTSRKPSRAVASIVSGRSSSSVAPVRASFRSFRSARRMARVPISTSPSRSRNSRLSHTFTARRWRPGLPIRTPSGL